MCNDCSSRDAHGPAARLGASNATACKRERTETVVEPDAIAGELIKGGGFNLGVPIGAQSIDADLVGMDEQYMGSIGPLRFHERKSTRMFLLGAFLENIHGHVIRLRGAGGAAAVDDALLQLAGQSGYNLRMPRVLIIPLAFVPGQVVELSRDIPVFCLAPAARPAA